MLPEPKKVADAIRGLFRSPEERRQEKEMNRDVQVRMGKTRIRRHISHQQEMVTRLTNLAKRSLAINDEAHFRQVGKQLLWTQADIKRWEKYLLTVEVMESRRDQVRASVELMQTVKTLGDSISDFATPQQLAELANQLENGLVRAESLDERLAVMMEAMDATLESGMPSDEGALRELELRLSEDIAREESAGYDREIEEGLRKIRQELNGRENR